MKSFTCTCFGKLSRNRHPLKYLVVTHAVYVTATPLKFCVFGLRLFSVFANAYFFPLIYLPTNPFLVWVYWNQEFLRLKRITGWNHLFVLTRFTGLLEYLKYRIRVRRSLRRRISHTYYFWNYHRFWPIRSGVLIFSSSSQITPKSEKITQTSKESLDDA